MTDIFNSYQQNPKYMNQSTMTGVWKGIVVDVRDPFQLGRIKVHCYPLHGDYTGLPVSSQVWCEVSKSLRGQFSSFEIFDRVLISFETGDKKSPFVVGAWQATPTGRGKLPYSAKKGSDIRPEAWHNHNLYPESILLACSGPGNLMWIESKFVSQKDLVSRINLEDTGGKFFTISSFHLNAQDYAPIEAIPQNTTLDTLNLGGFNPTNDGFTTPPEVGGAIEFGNQNITRRTETSDSTYSGDILLQYNSDESIGIDSYAISGDILRHRQGQSAITLFNDCMTLNSQKPIMANNTVLTPERWDQ